MSLLTVPKRAKSIHPWPPGYVPMRKGEKVSRAKKDYLLNPLTGIIEPVCGWDGYEVGQSYWADTKLEAARLISET